MKHNFRLVTRQPTFPQSCLHKVISSGHSHSIFLWTLIPAVTPLKFSTTELHLEAAGKIYCGLLRMNISSPCCDSYHSTHSSTMGTLSPQSSPGLPMCHTSYIPSGLPRLMSHIHTSICALLHLQIWPVVFFLPTNIVSSQRQSSSPLIAVCHCSVFLTPNAQIFRNLTPRFSSICSPQAHTVVSLKGRALSYVGTFITDSSFPLTIFLQPHPDCSSAFRSHLEYWIF